MEGGKNENSSCVWKGGKNENSSFHSVLHHRRSSRSLPFPPFFLSTEASRFL
jgi:hypothetical protein